MASAWVAVVVTTLATSGFLCDASDFLQPAAKDKYIAKFDVERTLLSELSGLSTGSAIHNLEKDLSPMYKALPKNRKGTLEPSVVQYALHRYFVQKHGWYMLGLDAAGGAGNSETPSNIMKDRAPAYIQGLFEQHLKGRGMGLHELAVFAAVLSNLVHKEVLGGFHSVYTTLRLPTVGSVSQYWSEQAVKVYMMLYLVDLVEYNMTLTEVLQFDLLERELNEIYPDWPGTYMWVEDFRHTQHLLRKSWINPFQVEPITFESSAAFVQEIGHNFGSFQDLECKSLKGRLVEMEHQGTGRVRLSRFYAGGVNGDWTLSESVDYLRNLGVLDETDPKRPSVVISNYMTSQTNCLSASGFYSVCCSDECEGLRQHLEKDIAAPTADPARIVELVSALHSDTVDAPRNLSTALLARLDEIAVFHSGRVPLHGRLFAQWMHHAYPRECPFPHVSGTTSPMSPEDWMAHWGIDNVEATLEEMQWHHSRLSLEASTEDELTSLPWTDVEELVTMQESEAALVSPLRVVMAVAALASFAVPLLRASQAAMASSIPNKLDRLLV